MTYTTTLLLGSGTYAAIGAVRKFYVPITGLF